MQGVYSYMFETKHIFGLYILQLFSGSSLCYT
jgi:hypothetical protein